MKPLFACFSYNLDYALGWMVVHSLWQATAIALISGMIAIFLRKKAAKVRYWVHNIALLSVLLAAVGTFCYYYDFDKQPKQMRFIPSYGAEFGATPNFQDNVVNVIQTSVINLSTFKDYFNHNIPLIVTIWILGVALFMLKLLGGISYVYYLRSRMHFPADEYWVEMLDSLKGKAGVKQSIELVESALTRTPIVVGHLKPMILFPIGAINRLSPGEVEAILAHEIAHVLRKDYLFNIIQSIIEALFYFHPAVWWISANVRNERENCCDDVAIAICGNSMNYAKSLVTVQEMAYYPMYQPAMAFAGNRKNQLFNRVQRILNQPQNKTNVMEKLIATCSLVIVMIGLSFGENSLRLDNIDLTSSGSTNINSNEKSMNSLLPDSRLFDELQTNNTTKSGTFYLIFPNRVDSLKVPFDVPDGVYNYEDNTQSAQMTIKDNFVIALKVNNIDLTKEQLPNYKKLINKIIAPKAPSSSITGSFPSNKSDANGIYLFPQNEAGNHLTLNESGLSMQSSDNKGNTVNLKVDESGLYLDAIDENGQPFKLRVDKNGLSQQFPKVNEKPTTIYDGSRHNDLSKQRVDLITWQKALYTKAKSLGDKVDVNIFWTVKQSLDAAEKEIMKPYFSTTDLNKAKEKLNWVRTYLMAFENAGSKGASIADIETFRLDLRQKHRGLLNRTSVMQNKGINVSSAVNPTLLEIGRDLNKRTPTVEDLKITERKLEWVETFLDNKDEVDNSDYSSNDDVEELKNDMKNLRRKIKECDCTPNFDFRMGLITKINNLMPLLKPNTDPSVFNETEMKFLKIKNEWESGECVEPKSKKN